MTRSCFFPATHPQKPVCQKDQFQCSNGHCINIELLCNHFNDCEDYGSDEMSCDNKGALQPYRLLLRPLHIISADCMLWGECTADTTLKECRSDATMCGDGDEAQCVINGTVSFCSCKPGFQPTGQNTCQGKDV